MLIFHTFQISRINVYHRDEYGRNSYRYALTHTNIIECTHTCVKQHLYCIYRWYIWVCIFEIKLFCFVGSVAIGQFYFRPKSSPYLVEKFKVYLQIYKSIFLCLSCALEVNTFDESVVSRVREHFLKSSYSRSITIIHATTDDHDHFRLLIWSSRVYFFKQKLESRICHSFLIVVLFDRSTSKNL